MQGFQLFIASIDAERFGQNRQKMQNRRWGVDGNRTQIRVAAADRAFEFFQNATCDVANRPTRAPEEAGLTRFHGAV